MKHSYGIIDMTTAQRAKQNRENAGKSTGPKTDEGKEVSRQNSMRHGFTAKILALPDENPEEIQEQADAWVEALQPTSHDEDFLVDQIALGALKLQRFAKGEAETVAEQVRTAGCRWDVEQGARLLNSSRLLRKDPARAVLELKHFHAGVAWLIGRWVDLKKAFDEVGCWNNLELVREALRLSGFNPDRLDDESLDAYDLALQAACCVNGYKGDARVADFLSKQMPARWLGRFNDAEYPIDEAMEKISAHIDETLAELNNRAAQFDGDDDASREGARARAVFPADTPANRLFLRYMKSTESGFDRAIKTLAKLQADRKKAEEKESESANQGDPRNEATFKAKSSANPLHPGSWVTINKADFEVADVSDGNILLLPLVPPLHTPTEEPAMGSENDV